MYQRHDECALCILLDLDIHLPVCDVDIVSHDKLNEGFVVLVLSGFCFVMDALNIIGTNLLRRHIAGTSTMKQ